MGPGGRRCRLRLEERVRIRDVPVRAHVLDVWYPLVGDDASQQLLDVRLDLDQPLDVGHDQEHGNPMVHLRLLRPGDALEFRASYVVCRFDPAGQPAAAGAGGGARRPPLLRDLEVGLPAAEVAELSRLAAALAAGCHDPMARAARLGRAAVERGRAAAVERFVLLCRLAGIPARVVAGLRAAAVAGEHLWAEVFVADRGWVAADPLCGAACGDLWALGLDHVSRTRGQDLLLQPVQRGPRLAALSGPYAEVDGRPHPVHSAISASVEGPATAPAGPAAGARLEDLASLVTVEPDLLDPAPPRIRLAPGALLPPAAGDEWLYLVTAGRVRLSRLTLGGRRLELGVLAAPAFFQADRVRRGVAEALEASELRPLTRDEVLRMARRRPDFGFRLLETFGERLVESEDRMELLAYHGVPGRLALALLNRLGPRGIVEGVTHQQLADVVGASRETVTKVLGQLQAVGCVRLRHRRIEVVDVHRLAAHVDR